MILFTSMRWMSLLAALLLVSVFANGQPVRQKQRKTVLQFDRSKEISAQALNSSQAGDPGRAITLANAALQDCPDGEMGSACRALLNYTIGYVSQRQARTATSAADRERALTSAAASYRAALRDDPNNA